MLLDTHALFWLVSGLQTISDEALLAIGESQRSGRLFVSPVSAWELSLAVRKPNDAPVLGDISVANWFRAAIRATSAKVVAINQTIALEAAHVVEATGHKDPGDCFLIATARTKQVSLITRDKAIRRLSGQDILSVVVC